MIERSLMRCSLLSSCAFFVRSLERESERERFYQEYFASMKRSS
jgi:hypothetical protein